MSNSAFNMSKCGSGGGSGGSACNSGGWAEIIPTGGDEITVVSNDKLRQALREIWKENPQSHTTQIADMVQLKYDCPRVGDAVFWNSYKNGYDLASAEVDNSNYFKDSEHLVESLAIVEDVNIQCTDGQDVPDEGYTAKVVFFGKITFPNESTELDPGIVYYLSDTYAKINTSTTPDKIIGSNAVHAIHEPVISTPLFVATGKHTAIVTNYRPLTGSPTGGRPLSEEYKMRIDPHIYNNADGEFLYSGWKILIENTGTVTSRNHLLLQIEYNKLEGPQSKEDNPNLIGNDVYVHHVDIGVLHNEAEANIRNDDEIVSSRLFDFNPSTAPYVTGIGEISVRLKVITQSTANINFNDKLSSPEVLLVNSGDITKSTIVPTLQWSGRCDDNKTNNNDIYVKGDTVVTSPDSDEGSVFEIKLLTSTINSVGSTTPPVQLKIPMPYGVGFKIEAMTETVSGEFEVNSVWTPVTGTFKLSLPDREMLEVIPVSSTGATVVEQRLRIAAVNRDGTLLPDTHWAHKYSSEKLTDNLVFCFSNKCCIDGNEQFISENANSLAKNISSILSDGDSHLLNNKDNATFYSKSVNGTSWHGDLGTLALSWKNCRENTTFCFPPTDQGTTAAFMTIYANEARPISNIAGHQKTDNEGQFYDPRYALMEIGAQETLNNKSVRLTVNSGSASSSAPETCFTFKFSGSERGNHFTIQELEHFDPDTFYKHVL